MPGGEGRLFLPQAGDEGREILGDGDARDHVADEQRRDAHHDEPSHPDASDLHRHPSCSWVRSSTAWRSLTGGQAVAHAARSRAWFRPAILHDGRDCT